MPQIVDVKGLGELEFPDEMSQEEMGAAIEAELSRVKGSGPTRKAAILMDGEVKPAYPSVFNQEDSKATPNDPVDSEFDENGIAKNTGSMFIQDRIQTHQSCCSLLCPGL